MKVKQLIKQLQKLDPNFIVIMSRDPEGNNFSPLEEISPLIWRAEHEEVVNSDEGDEDEKDNCVVFWPSR